MMRSYGPARSRWPVEMPGQRNVARDIADLRWPRLAVAMPRQQDAPAYLIAITLGLALFGYESLAPIFQLFAPEGSGAAILLRAFILILCGLCLHLCYRRRHAAMVALIPLFAFLFLYTLRLYDNYFVRELYWDGDPAVMFGILIGGIIIPCFVLPSLVPSLDDRPLVMTQVGMMITFLVGLAFNWEALLVASEHSRAGLEKLNPISLGATASSFALLLAIVRSPGAVSTIGKFLLIGLLVGVTAFAQSRGPIVATGLALLVFGLMSRGQHRKYLIRATVLAGVALALTPYLLGIDLVEFSLQRFHLIDDELTSAGLGRANSWRAAWAQFLDSPLIGDLVFEPELLRYPHNLFLESLISLGLFGTYILFIHLILCFKYCFRLLAMPASSLLDKFISMIFLKEFVGLQFSGAIWGSATFFISSACVIVLGAARQQKRRPAAPATVFERRLDL